MSSNRLWGLGALAVIDVMLAVATDLIAEAIGTLGAFAIAGTLFLAITVTFGKLVMREDPARASGWLGRQALLFLSVAGALGLFAIAAMNAPPRYVAHDQPLPSTPGTSSPAPSPSPAQLSLSQFLAKWQNGPVKLTVEHYNSWVSRADGKDDIDATIVDLRVSVRNESTEEIDLATAPDSLVLIMNEPFDDGTYAVDQQRIGEVPPEWYLYAVGFDNEDNFVEIDGKKHTIHWSGGTMGVGEDFSSSSPAQNGAAFAVPPPAAKSASEIDAVAPKAAHVLGLAWLGSDGTVQGYTPVECWAGPNSADSFLKA